MIDRQSLVSIMIIACALVVQTTLAAAEERPCRAVIEKFCPDVKLGGRAHGRVLAPAPIRTFAGVHPFLLLLHE